LIFDIRNGSYFNPVGFSDEVGGHVGSFSLEGGSFSDWHKDDGFEFFLSHITEVVHDFSVFIDLVVSGNFRNVGHVDSFSVDSFNITIVSSSVFELE